MNQERFDDLATGLANDRLSRRQVLKSIATGVLAAMLPVLWGKPAGGKTAYQQAQEPCIRRVKVWINAFIPDHVSGVTEPHPTKPKQTVIRGPLHLKNSCFYTDQRSFSSNINASSRMHSEIEIDLIRQAIVYQKNESSGTTEVNCKSGAVTCKKTAKVRADRGSGKPFFDFQTSKDRVSVRLDAAANDPCVTGSPDVDYEGKITLERVGPSKSNVKVTFDGNVDPFPAFEMYTAADGRTPKTLFQRPSAAGKNAWNLAGDANKPVLQSVTLRANCPPDMPDCCDGQCVNTQTDEDNCGGCGIVCPQGKTCTDGRCECPPGEPNCLSKAGNPES